MYTHTRNLSPNMLYFFYPCTRYTLNNFRHGPGRRLAAAAWVPSVAAVPGLRHLKLYKEIKRG